MAQCLYIRIWRNTDSHRIRYQTWRCLWNLIWFWFTHSFTIKLKHGANIREISEIAKGFLVFNTSGVPQIWLSLRPPIFNSRMNTDFFAAWGAWNLKGSRRFRRWRRFFDLFGQIYAVFSTPLPPSAKRDSLSHSQALALSIRARDVAGNAIALPEFWSASGACALKGWLGCLISIFLSRPGPSSRRGFLTPSLLASSLPSLSCPQ